MKPKIMTSLKEKQAVSLPLVVFLIFISLTSCVRERIEGNYDVVIRQQTSAPFSAVASNGNFRVFIQPGETTQIELKGESNVLPFVKVVTENNRLSIGFKSGYSIHENYPVEIYIRTPELNRLRLSGSGLIESELFSCEEADIELSGSGSIDCRFIAASLDADVSGSGLLSIEGRAEEGEMLVSGSGEIDALGFEQQHCEAEISGSGKIYVLVNDLLEARVSGSGIVYYRGDPHVISQISGSGKVVRY